MVSRRHRRLAGRRASAQRGSSGATAGPVALLERLLDRARERKQPLFDQDRHLADIADGLAALVENARIPLDAADQLVDFGLVMTGGVLQLPKLKDRRSDLVGKFLLLAREPLDAVHDLAAFVIERFEKPRENQLG